MTYNATSPIRPIQSRFGWLSAFALIALSLVFGSLAQAQGTATPTIRPDPAGASASTDLASLPLPAQATISATLGRDDAAYHARTQDVGLQVTNPRHGLTAAFTPAGVEVRSGTARWGLSLTGVGYGNTLSPVSPSAPKAMANRVEYSRGSLTEWYVNGPLGLEQGFTLTAPPENPTGGPLGLTLMLSGDLTAALDPHGEGVTLTSAQRTPTFRYRGLTAFDATGRSLPAWLDLRGAQLLLRVDDAGARYPLVVDPFIQQAKLTASDGVAYDGFGGAVALSGDTVVVGAWTATVSGHTQQGAAYVFVKPPTGWANVTQTAKLTASDGATYDNFGNAVALSGDTVVVGAPLAPYNSSTHTYGPGTAYVFVKPGTGWADMTQTAKLTASDGVAGDHFGFAVALSGDTVVVGAWAATISGHPSQGAAYVFHDFALTVTPGGNGGGSITSSPAGINCGTICGAAFPPGASVTLTATPAPGSTFTGWSGDGCSGVTNPTCTVTVTEAENVTATFILTAVPTPAVVQVSVDATAVTRTVDPRSFGLNTAMWDPALDTPATIALLRANQTGSLRFPGGSNSDSYHWQTNKSDGNTWTWASDFEAFAAVAQGIGAAVYITVNYGSGTPQEAADWVRYSNIAKGYGFKYWEIGNENYGSWENDTHARPHDPYTYATLAKDYILQMKAADPSIKVGVVVVTGEDSFANYSDHPATNSRTGQVHNGWTPVLLTTLKSLGVTPDFLIYHMYEIQGPGQEDDALLLQDANNWAYDATDLRQQLTDYLGPQGASVEIVCTETSSSWGQPGKQSTSLVSGLFLADSFAQMLRTEFNTFLWWDLRNDQEPNNNNSPVLYGWRQYGDQGIVSRQNDPYPTYYVSKLLAHFARGGEQVLAATSTHTYGLLAAYAVRHTDGTLALLVINKSPTSDLNASITLHGFTPHPLALVHSYGVPQDEAARTGTGLPDVAHGSFGAAAASFAYTFPAYSATVLSLTPAGSPQPPSVAFSLSRPVLHTGQQLTLAATVTPGDPSVTADVYVALQLPGGSLLFLQGNGSFTSALTPIVSTWTVNPFSGPIFSYTFTGGEPVGSYAWLAAFSQPGTLNFIGPIVSAPFAFSP